MNLFIFGPQRTGSTLLHRLLEEHPEIDSTPNDLNLLDIYSSGIPDTLKWRQWGLEDNVIGALRKLKKADFLKNIVDKYFREADNNVRLHKTCKGEFDLSIYRRAFGERVKFIYILRNPVAIMASRKYWEQPDRENKWIDITNRNLSFTDVYRSFRYIQRHLGLLFESIRIIDQVSTSKDTLAVVGYEQLVNHPKRILNELFAKLGVQPKAPPATDGSHRKPIDPYTSHKELEGRKGIYANAIDIWKTKLTKFEIRLLYNEMVKFRDREFSSKFVLFLFDMYMSAVKEVVEGD